MAFKKGKSGNPNGRKPGVQNKTTADMREFIKMLLEQEQPRFLDAMGTLDGEAYCRVYIRLLDYVTPKQKDFTVAMETTPTTVSRYVLPDGTVIEL